mmetsp:Transcript_20025/g.28760  ORF Transcript_20025/g.28760 Transcript_20025/m.28760 type:complete len:1080 (+) Transcript_20025:95-3334(+)
MLREIGTDTVYSLRFPGKTTIGRAKDCDIQPESSSVSKRHAELDLIEDGHGYLKEVWIEDLGSRNGVYTGQPDKWNIVNRRRRIRYGDCLKFGHSATYYILEDASQGTQTPLRTSANDTSILQQRSPLNVSPDPGFVHPYANGGQNLVDSKTDMPTSETVPQQDAALGDSMKASTDSLRVSGGKQSPIQPEAAIRRARTSDDALGSSGSPLFGEWLDGFPGVQGDQSQPLHPPKLSASLQSYRLQGNRSSATRMTGRPASASAQLPPYRTSRSVSPLSGEERRAVERSREQLSDGVRMANKALGGVIEFDDWKKYASRILSNVNSTEESLEQTKPRESVDIDDTRIRSLMTAEVIDACRAEKHREPRDTAGGALLKVETNLNFLLEYDISLSSGNSRGIPSNPRSGVKFDGVLFNGVLKNCVGLLESKVSGSAVVQAVDRASKAAALKVSASPSRRQAESPSIEDKVKKIIIPKLHGLVTFNESMGSGTSVESVLNSEQIENVNRHIILNVLQDVLPMLRTLSEVRNRATGERRLVPSSHRGATVSGSDGGVSALEPGSSLDNMSARLSADGELRISSDPPSPSRSIWDKLGISSVEPSRKIENKKPSWSHDATLTSGAVDSPRKNWSNAEHASKIEAARGLFRGVRRMYARLMAKKFHRWIVHIETKRAAQGVVSGLMPGGHDLENDLSHSSDSVASVVAQREEELQQLRSEKERIEEEKVHKEGELVSEINNLLRRNTLLQEKGFEDVTLAKKKLVILKLFFTHGQHMEQKKRSYFSRWHRNANQFQQVKSALSSRRKQLMRVLRLQTTGSLARRLMNRAFRTWERNCLRIYEAVLRDATQEGDIRALKSRILELQEELHVISSSDSAASGLLAERALNREVTAVNIDLEQRLSDIQMRLLEVAGVPPSERKQIVREVLLDRENEVRKARKEIRTLKEQVARLELSLKSPSSKGIKGKKGRENKPESDYHLERSHGHDRDEFNLSKTEAMKIVARELRNLQRQCAELEDDKIRLGHQLYEETARYQQQSMSFRLLQQRLMEKERKYEALHASLIKRFGEQEALRLVDSMEINGRNQI